MQTRKKVILGLVGMVSVCLALTPLTTKAAPVEQDTAFQVNVKETLTVSISTPTTWASGNVDTFLRNKVNVSVTTNNASGFVVGMTTATSDTNLVNELQSTSTIPTLSSSWNRNSSVTNFWGYSLNDSSDNGTYNPMVGSNSSPIEIFDSTQGNSKDVYFGAKVNSATASGTYVGTVVISAVTDVTDFPGTQTNPNTPSAPENPATPSPAEEVAVYRPSPSGDSSNGATVYTYRRTNTSAGTTTTTTQVSDGNNTTAYNSYTPPQGVRQSSEITESNIVNDSSLATTLAVTSAIAAATGLGFFIIAKRREDDDEEEQLQ